VDDETMTTYRAVQIIGDARRRLLVIFNPTAGRRRRRTLAAALRLLDGRADITRQHTRARGDAEAFAGLVPEGAIALVAGGDGTANEVANGLLAAGGGDMAILPLGTANVLAAELGIVDMASAAEAAATGSRFAYRPGLANGRGFLMMAGVGFDAHVVAGVSRRLKRFMGKGAYVAESLRQLWSFSFPRYRVTVDDSDTWATAWTAEWPFKATDAKMYGADCHEGNYALPDILRGARAQEK